MAAFVLERMDDFRKGEALGGEAVTASVDVKAASVRGASLKGSWIAGSDREKCIWIATGSGISGGASTLVASRRKQRVRTIFMTSSNPPVPARLREMLKAYPDYLEQIRQLLQEVADEPAAAPRLELAIWALEGRASRFLAEAKAELSEAEQGGDPEQIATSGQKELVMGRMVIQKPWLGDKDFVDYFRK